MNNKQQDLMVIYGVLRGARESLGAAHGRSVLGTRTDIAKRITDIDELLRTVCRDLARELGL